MERDVAGSRGEVAVIVAAAVALTGPAALVASSLRQGLRLLFQQLVQGFLHAAADQFLDLPLDNFLIQLYNFLGHSLLSPFECLCGNFILPESASYVFFYAVFNLRNLLYLIRPDSISITAFCLIAGDIFPLIQKCSLYSFQCFYFTVRYIGSISETSELF